MNNKFLKIIKSYINKLLLLLLNKLHILIQSLYININKLK